MASIFALWLLLALAFAEAVVDGSEVGESRSCSPDRIGYLRLRNDYRFFINDERIDDRALMCKALAFYFASQRLEFDSQVEWGAIGRRYCGREFKYATDLRHPINGEELHMSGRKLLLQANVDSSNMDHLGIKQLSKANVKIYRLTISPKSNVLAVPGMFLLCCVVTCPCFRAKRKEPFEQRTLAKEPNSSDAISPFDGSISPDRNPTIHKIPQSPSHFPFSPRPDRTESLQLNLTINQIIKATQNFSPLLKLGEGGFGTVYKGILGDGHVVAIKRAKKEHFSALRDEFISEVELLARIDHRSLVRFLGYTENENERIIVTEYVPNGTLREHLDGLHGHILNFNQRLQIAIDVAHALTYLHLYAEKPIIHRDVKASNILLTESFLPKVSDFGFARAGPTEAGQTHISTQVKGTAGYLDPEYLRTYQLTPKSDVFSFGILLIELLSARRPVEMRRSIDERITVRWAVNKFNEGNVREILDPKFQESINIEVVTKMLSLAFHCAAPTRSNRPLMKEVGEQLWEIRKEFGNSIRTE